jgi:uncharacterized protein (DUF934 family)
MRRILKRRELVEDEWRYLGEESADGTQSTGGDGGAGPALIVPFAAFRGHIEEWRAYTGRLGVRLSPPDAVEELAPDIHRLSLVAAEFPSPGEGRGYSQGRLLRSRLHFKGELRAVGAGVKQDLLFILRRCGFNSFELAPGQKFEEALKALERYTVAYQPGEPTPSIQLQRYSTAR